MAAELAVRGILVLAKRQGTEPVPLEDICRQRGLPRDYLVRIFRELARAGLVRPVRGRGGGYLLAKQPRDITLLDVIEAVEGPLALNLCQTDPPRCEQQGCPVKPVWSDLQERFRSALASKTLADLTEGDLSVLEGDLPSPPHGQKPHP